MDELTFIICALTAMILWYGIKSYLQTQKVAKQLQQYNFPDESQFQSSPLTIKTKVAKPTENLGTFKIYFASQTGTAEGFARSLAEEASSQGFQQGAAIDFLDFDPIDFAQTDLLFIVASTIGEGDPPDNAIGFYEWLKEDNQTPLQNINYSVFGVGDKSYTHYNTVAKYIDKMLENRGARRIHDLGLGDDGGNLEDDFNRWKEAAWKRATLYARKIRLQAQSPLSARRDVLVCFIPPDQVNKTFPEQRLSNIGSEFQKAQLLQITKMEELKKGDKCEKSCIHIEAECPPNTYTTGQNVAVYFENNAQMVDEFCKLQNYDPDAIFIFKTEGSSVVPFQTPCSIRMAINQFVDIQGPVRRTALKILAIYFSKETERNQIQFLAENKEAYEKLIFKECKGLYDLAREYRSLRIPFKDLVLNAPKLQPRLYTIASSNSMNPTSLHLVMSVVSITTTTKNAAQENIQEQRNGVCTGYFYSRLHKYKNLKVKMVVKNSVFKVPQEDVPVIMIAAGAGIAPFRGFLQEFASTGYKGSPIYLYFGVRSEQEFLYKQELESYIKTSETEKEKCEHRPVSFGGNVKQVLDKLYIVYSREEHKIYIQDLIKEHAARISDLILNKKGKIYLCGSTAMGKAVTECLPDIEKSSIIAEYWG